MHNRLNFPGSVTEKALKIRFIQFEPHNADKAGAHANQQFIEAERSETEDISNGRNEMNEK
jgi:hypothetical protein